jgi:hypothetical protein
MNTIPIYTMPYNYIWYAHGSTLLRPTSQNHYAQCRWFYCKKCFQAYPCKSSTCLICFICLLLSPPPKGILKMVSLYEGLPKISENLNIPRKPLALRTSAARCLFLYLSTNSVAIGFFVSARVSEFWLLSLHHCHECLRLSKWRELRSKELVLNFASNSTKLQLRPTKC